MSSLVSCEHQGGVHFSVNVRGHCFSVDMPVDAGGEDNGPNPPELFIASLASCIGVFVARYCKNNGLPYEGFSVDLTYEIENKPYRVKSITGDITMPKGFPPERYADILIVGKSCLVHNTLHNPPSMDIEVVEG